MAITEKYIAVSRVVSGNSVVGFMVSPLEKRSKTVYMSIDVISFGLNHKTFEIQDVKLGSNGKPRGSNGFMLSKLPIINLMDRNETYQRLSLVLRYLLKEFGKENDKSIKYSTGQLDTFAKYSATCVLDDYSDMGAEIGTKELKDTLNFYKKHLPKELKSCVDKVECSVSEKGVSTIPVSKNLVIEGVVENANK